MKDKGNNMDNLDKDEFFGIDSTRWSRYDYDDLLQEMEELEQMGELPKKFPRFPELHNDVYHYLWKAHPSLKSQAEVDPSVKNNVALVGYMRGLEELNVLRAYTEYDRIASMVATRRIKEIVEKLPDEVKDALEDSQKRGKEAEQKREQLEAWRQYYKQMGNDPKKLKQIQKQGQKVRNQADRAMKESGEAQAQLEQSLRDNESLVRAAIRAGLSQAAQDAQEIQECMEIGCGNEDADPRKLPVDTQIALARRLQNDPKMKRIIKLAGRIQRIAERGKQSKIVDSPDAIVDVKLGRRIDDLIGSERVKLLHPVARAEVISRLYDSRALVWKKEGKEVLGKGPIICVVDSSGSMAGMPEEWAKAVAITLWKEAQKRGQPFHYIHFSTSMDEKTFEGKAGEELEFLDFSSIFHNGGTNFALPLDAIHKIYTEKKVKWADKADVIFVSDGAFPIGSIPAHVKVFREDLKRTDGQCFGVLIGTEKKQADTLKAFADHVYGIDPSQGDAVVMDIFRRMER